MRLLPSVPVNGHAAVGQWKVLANSGEGLQSLISCLQNWDLFESRVDFRDVSKVGEDSYWILIGIEPVRTTFHSFPFKAILAEGRLQTSDQKETHG
ncbi:hypothetical protein JTE90_021635 [Oedothorax gibbosus]|uniref:Uncharacterized protein n=1 Tax=Oedothorax gibbosus TaxID=931172 RepID=A0AAV6VRK1_9ARAC|nr:hypothetical protein JTE90_021635 [Oedothorax gibbosus]